MIYCRWSTASCESAPPRICGVNRPGTHFSPRRLTWQSRAHFFGLAAQMMRRILVDHARARRAARRPDRGLRVTLIESAAATPPLDCEILLLDQVLGELATLDPRQAQIVELRYFGGFPEDEVAKALNISRSTVTREWQTARAWMYRRLTKGRTPHRSSIDRGQSSFKSRDKERSASKHSLSA